MLQDSCRPEGTAISASFEWCERNGAGGTETQIGTTGNISDFKNLDSAGTTGYTANPITAGLNSYEKWFRMHFFGTFNRIDGARFWMSTNFSPSTGLHVFFNGQQSTYLQPFSGTSSIATSSVPIADPGSTNVTINGSLSGSLVASGYTDHLVLQLRTDATAAAGDTSLATFSASYNES